METATTTLLTGDEPLVLDRYRRGRRLGSGGFGTVWLAHDTKLNRAVALKRIPVGDAAVAQRARREALACARLSHPAIVALHETAADDEAVYLVSEVVQGHTLDELCDGGELSDRDVLRIGIALCDALAHAHRRGVVHRDVKPQNVLVPADGDGPAAKLTDFGIARIAGDDALTRTGDVVGTLAYMAPEQAEGHEAGPAADLYALALCLYEALAGLNPVRGRGAAATARRVGRRLPPLGRLRRDLPLALCQAIDAAVWPSPEERGTLRELRDALAAALPEAGDEPGTIAGGHLEPLVPVAPPPRTGVRVRLAAALLAAALTAGALALLGPVPPVAPGYAALGVATLVALFPRMGWIAAAAAVVAWAAGEQPGTAVLLAAACAPVPLLLRSAPPVLWSLPGAAPLLGFAYVAGAFPAIAGQPRRVLHRAALGAAGGLWLLLGEALLSERLLTGGDAAPRAAFEADAARAFEDALWPVLSSPAAAVIAIWALAAAALPVLVRGRTLALDLVGATAWASATAAAVQGVAPAEPRGLVAGAVAAGLIAVGLAASRPRA